MNYDILCDIKDCKVLVPTYWWRGLLELAGWIRFVCGYHRDGLIEDGIAADEFIIGGLVGRNHWRPDA